MHIYKNAPPQNKSWREDINKQTGFPPNQCTYCTHLAGFYTDDTSPWVLSSICTHSTFLLLWGTAFRRSSRYWITPTSTRYFGVIWIVHCISTTSLANSNQAIIFLWEKNSLEVAHDWGELYITLCICIIHMCSYRILRMMQRMHIQKIVW